tara:strand:+ start:645 stop:755 length:111 start_codon:yes stop_codon:yes gene_type:complete
MKLLGDIIYYGLGWGLAITIMLAISAAVVGVFCSHP